jgi:hypothetical protein
MAAITSAPGGSASSQASVAENGTEYRAVLSVQNSSCMGSNTSQGLEFTAANSSQTMNKIEFSGSLRTANPCTELSLDVMEREDAYTVKLDRSASRGTCVQCLGSKQVKGSVYVPDGNKVDFVNRGERVYSHTFEADEIRSQEPVAPETGRASEERELDALKQIIQFVIGFGLL